MEAREGKDPEVVEYAQSPGMAGGHEGQQRGIEGANESGEVKRSINSWQIMIKSWCFVFF